MTYYFTSADGKDLDTRTQIISPITTNEVGWCKSNGAAPYLYWGGDNTGFGVESVYVDLTQFSSSATVSVTAKAWWYNIRNSGDMTLEIVAYSGGTMQKVGYGFVNNGGIQTNFTGINKNIMTLAGNCTPNPDLIKTITYNKSNNTLTFTP
jgi:hypothetical protein